jgi:hypothetical protein
MHSSDSKCLNNQLPISLLSRERSHEKVVGKNGIVDQVWYMWMTTQLILLVTLLTTHALSESIRVGLLVATCL